MSHAERSMNARWSSCGTDLTLGKILRVLYFSFHTEIVSTGLVNKLQKYDGKSVEVKHL